MTRRDLFVTGTDTGVGKTRAAAALCRGFAGAGLQVAGMKPVASGGARTADGWRNEDALQLLAAMNVPATYEEVNPYVFEPAIAPHIALAETGGILDDAVLDRACERLRLRSDLLIVEGAGGWLAPLDESRCFADLAVRWALDVILVVGLPLGCLNHALLTAEAVERRGLRLAGWIGNRIDPHFDRLEENLATLERRLAAPCWGRFAYAPQADPRDLTAGIAAFAAARPRYVLDSNDI